MTTVTIPIEERELLRSWASLGTSSLPAQHLETLRETLYEEFLEEAKEHGSLYLTPTRPVSEDNRIKYNQNIQLQPNEEVLTDVESFFADFPEEFSSFDTGGKSVEEKTSEGASYAAEVSEKTDNFDSASVESTSEETEVELPVENPQPVTRPISAMPSLEEWEAPQEEETIPDVVVEEESEESTDSEDSEDDWVDTWGSDEEEYEPEPEPEPEPREPELPKYEQPESLAEEVIVSQRTNTDIFDSIDVTEAFTETLRSTVDESIFETPILPKAENQQVSSVSKPSEAITPVYSTLREFVKQNPNCEIAEAVKYFPPKEIEAQIRRGRVYRKNGRLSI